MIARYRLPDFAGVALVDILANGVGMLIIIIVISIAHRYQQEERSLRQVDEVATVLSRQFATSLILNKLAASQPARLHDYERSPLDLNPRLATMPIIELHRDFVRDFYSGDIYLREELLRENNPLDALFSNYTLLQKQRVRTDIYDIQQFYLLSSIMRSHGIRQRHWHFIGRSGIGRADARACPGGVAGGDCVGLGGGEELASENLLSELLGGEGEGEGEGEGKGESDGEGEGEANGGGAGGDEAGAQGDDLLSAFPSDVDLGALGGGGESGRFSPNEAEQFSERGDRGGSGVHQEPDGAYEQLGRGMGAVQGSHGGQGDTRQARPSRARFRLAAPDKARWSKEDERRLGVGRPVQRQGEQLPPLRDILSVMLSYMRDIQAHLDEDRSPLAMMSGFEENLRDALAAPPPLEDADQEFVETLVRSFIAYWPDDTPPSVNVIAGDTGADGALLIAPNAPIESLSLSVDPRRTQVPADALKGGRVFVSLNLFPSAYRGLDNEMARYGVVLAPPEQQRKSLPRWRVVSYITPAFDDFVIGFVNATVEEDGRWRLDVDDNRVRLGQRRLRDLNIVKALGARSWLTLFYSAVILGLLGLLLVLMRRGWWLPRLAVKRT